MFRRKTESIAPPEWVIVGLGNPGPEYRGTRHNVGFDVADAVADRWRVKLDQNRHRAKYGVGVVEETSVVLVKPLTYMNLSGQAVAPIAKHYGIPVERILVVADDLDLEIGRTRLKPKGSAGGHNGHRSLIASLASSEYPRIKIGIGNKKGETLDHVLSAFTPKEREVIDLAVRKSADAIAIAVSRGVEAAMNFLNEGRPSGSDD